MTMKYVVALFLFTFTVKCVFATEVVFACEDQELFPYYMGNVGYVLSEEPGISIDMIKMMDEMLDGLDITIVRMPWTRCKYSLQSGLVDGIFNASYKKKRLKFGRYPTIDNTRDGMVDSSLRLTTLTYSLYTLKGSAPLGWDGNTFTNKHLRVGAPRGYSIVDDLRKKGIRVSETDKSAQNLKKLLVNRIDAVALLDVSGDSLIKANPVMYRNVEKVKPPLVEKEYYLMLSHQFVNAHTNLATKIWNTIRIVRETAFEQLAEKYVAD